MEIITTNKSFFEKPIQKSPPDFDLSEQESQPTTQSTLPRRKIIFSELESNQQNPPIKKIIIAKNTFSSKSQYFIERSKKWIFFMNYSKNKLTIYNYEHLKKVIVVELFELKGVTFRILDLKFENCKNRVWIYYEDIKCSTTRVLTFEVIINNYGEAGIYQRKILLIEQNFRNGEKSIQANFMLKDDIRHSTSSITGFQLPFYYKAVNDKTTFDGILCLEFQKFKKIPKNRVNFMIPYNKNYLERKPITPKILSNSKDTIVTFTREHVTVKKFNPRTKKVVRQIFLSRLKISKILAANGSSEKRPENFDYKMMADILEAHLDPNYDILLIWCYDNSIKKINIVVLKNFHKQDFYLKCLKGGTNRCDLASISSIDKNNFALCTSDPSKFFINANLNYFKFEDFRFSQKAKEGKTFMGISTNASLFIDSFKKNEAIYDTVMTSNEIISLRREKFHYETVSKVNAEYIVLKQELFDYSINHINYCYDGFSDFIAYKGADRDSILIIFKLFYSESGKPKLRFFTKFNTRFLGDDLCEKRIDKILKIDCDFSRKELRICVQIEGSYKENTKVILERTKFYWVSFDLNGNYIRESSGYMTNTSVEKCYKARNTDTNHNFYFISPQSFKCWKFNKESGQIEQFFEDIRGLGDKVFYNGERGYIYSYWVDGLIECYKAKSNGVEKINNIRKSFIKAHRIKNLEIAFYGSDVYVLQQRKLKNTYRTLIDIYSFDLKLKFSFKTDFLDGIIESVRLFRPAVIALSHSNKEGKKN